MAGRRWGGAWPCSRSVARERGTGRQGPPGGRGPAPQRRGGRPLTSLYDLRRVERRRGRAQVVAAFALLLAMVTAGVLATRYDPPAAGPLPSLGTIPVGRQPSAMAVGHGALWVANQGDGTLSRVDLATDRVVATVPVGDAADVVAAGPDAVWVGGWSRRAGNTVSRADPLTNRVVATVPLASEPYGPPSWWPAR
jgi:YVTN family beta-propeller protein